MALAWVFFTLKGLEMMGSISATLSVCKEGKFILISVIRNVRLQPPCFTAFPISHWEMTQRCKYSWRKSVAFPKDTQMICYISIHKHWNSVFLQQNSIFIWKVINNEMIKWSWWLISMSSISWRPLRLPVHFLHPGWVCRCHLTSWRAEAISMSFFTRWTSLPIWFTAGGCEPVLSVLLGCFCQLPKHLREGRAFTFNAEQRVKDKMGIKGVMLVQASLHWNREMAVTLRSMEWPGICRIGMVESGPWEEYRDKVRSSWGLGTLDYLRSLRRGTGSRKCVSGEMPERRESVPQSSGRQMLWGLSEQRPDAKTERQWPEGKGDWKKKPAMGNKEARQK